MRFSFKKPCPDNAIDSEKDVDKGFLFPRRIIFGASFFAAVVFSFLFVITDSGDNALKSIKPDNKREVRAFEIEVKGNDTFYALLAGIGLKPEEAEEVVKKVSGLYDLKRIRQGDIIKVTSVDGSVERLEYRYTTLDGVFAERQSDGSFIVESFTAPSSVETVVLSAIVEDSFYSAGVKAGIEPEIIMELSDVFAWDVDFSTETRRGDVFSVLFERVYAENNPIGTGNIIGAEVINDGERYAAIYYKDKDGKADYYDEQGKSLRRTLLKSPLRYRRISSYFTKNRFHPVLRRYRPHHGIDYAAPSGTPVEASGDGKVIFAGRKGGYGNLITIRHNSTYTTSYGHLKKIKSGLRVGSRVTQGAVIGYVGSTGISTGPHLHYEIHVNGRLTNPLKVKPTPGRSLKGGELAAFSDLRNAIIARLSAERTLVASNGR